jgi:hypothetical protein
VTYVRSALVPLAANASDQKFVACPGGQRPIGGGVAANFGDISVYQTLPGTATSFEGMPTGWWGGVKSFNGVAGTFYTYAVCAPANATSTYGLQVTSQVGPSLRTTRAVRR